MATLLPSRSVVYTASTIKLNSTIVSLGLSTNQTYSNLSNGSYSNWINAASSLSLSTIKRVAMSSNGAYQLIVVGSSAALYLSTDSGVTWITKGAAGFLGTGLPVVSTAYTYGAISANGQYILVCVNAGSLYVSSNYGASFTNVSLPSVAATSWFAFENNTTDSGTSPITPTVTGTMYYVTGKVGTYALSLVNPPNGVAVNYLRGIWTAPANCSITMWVCPQALTGAQQEIFSTYGNAIQLFIDATNRLYAYFATGSNTGANVTSSINLSVNTWYHVALIFQSYGACSFYINGVLQGTGTNTAGYSTWGNTGLFGLGTYDNSAYTAYCGYIDDLRLYNYAIVPSGAPPQNFNFAAMSGTGQYMTVTSPGTIAYSSNYGQTWTTPYGLTTAGQMSGLAVSNTGQYMVAQNGGIIMPNSALATAYTWMANGIIWTVSASSIYTASYPAYLAFNNVYSGGGTGWASAATYSASSPYAYTGGSVTTVIQNVGTIGGEWLQLQSSIPLVLSSYTFGCATYGNIPKNYYIVGSTDGTTWYPIQYATGNTNPMNATYQLCYTYLNANTTSTQYIQSAVTGSWTTTSYATSANAYTYFRILATHIFFNGTAFEIGDLYMNFSGGVSYSTNYGSTWTNTTNTAIIATGPSAVSGNGQYTLTSMGPTGQTALVTTNYVASPYTAANGCILYYPLNDASGTASVMEIMNGYNSTDKNVTFGFTGKVGTCASCSNSYLAIPSTAWSSWTTLSAGSIACWIKPSATALTGAASQLFAKYISGSYYHTMLSIGLYYNGSSLVTGTAGKVYFSMSNTQYSAGCSSNTVLLADTWYHIVVTFNGSAVLFYINGVLDNTYNCNWTLTGVVTNMVLCTGVSYPFSGYMDDFSLWNVALPQSTITALATTISPTLTSINSAIVGTALSYTGQYQVLVTGGATNNVYYSTNYGQTFTGITVGSSLTLLGCTCSADGSYITVYTASAVYTLNNNSSGNSVAIGNAAGLMNQGSYAISIGSYASLTNQVTNSIVLNATGSTLNATTAGLFVGPIQPASATGVSSLNFLGYGADNQVVKLNAIANDPTVQRITATGSGTYIPAAGVVRIRVRMCGGGGGATGAINGTAGTIGGTTTFGAWTAIYGSGGTTAGVGGAGGSGGAAGTGTLITRFTGGQGTGGGNVTYATGGRGGTNPFGGGGSGSYNGATGGAAVANTGGGGGGAGGGNGITSGPGGGAGEYVEFYVSAPPITTYTVGAGGAGGTGGGYTGGAGAAGVIIIEEMYI